MQRYPARGVWLNNATPLTTRRDALPEWNSDEIAPKLRALVDRLSAAGELSEGKRYIPPPATITAEPQYGDIDISEDPRDWDPMSPRRFMEGHADLVRRLRREYLGLEPRVGEIIRR